MKHGKSKSFLVLSFLPALIAFNSSSTNFYVRQNIQEFSGGDATFSLSTSTSFKSFAAGAQTGIGTSTGFSGSETTIFITSTAQTSWTVPSDWNSSNNSIEVIGGGGGGATTTNAGGGGGGGGAYSKKTNVSLTPNASVTIKVGTGGVGQSTTTAPTAGEDTYLCNSTSNCASIAGSAVQVGAKGGNPGSSTAGGTGGSSGSGVGTTLYSGGNGGEEAGGAGGGGGSGGPNGNGAAGGNGSINGGGAGGGGSGGGSVGASPSGLDGGNGGNNYSSSGGGTGGTGPSTEATAGTNGGGGGGGFISVNFGHDGASGGSGTEWDPSHGAGGGGGGSAASGSDDDGKVGGNGGLYGGGGGGGAQRGTTGTYEGVGGRGSQGIIVIKYTPASVGTLRALSGILRSLSKGVVPEYTQIHYHFRNDNGTEATATSGTSGVEDTATSSVPKLATKRLRVAISNEGGTLYGFATQQFRLEYATKSGTCAAASGWTDVGAVGGDFDMSNSANLTEGADTSNVAVATGGVSDENTLFIGVGGVRDTTSQTGATYLPSSQFMEIEYAIAAQSAATDGATYCFRVTNNGSTSKFTYTRYPEMALTGSALSFFVDSGSVSLGNLVPGTGLVSSTSTLTVNTSNSTGFYITAVRDDSDTTMDLDTDATTNISDKTAWSAPAATTTTGNSTASSTEPLTLQFRVRQAGTDSPNYASTWWGTNDTSGSALFAGFPATAQKIINRSTATAGNSASVVLYNLSVPTTQQNGAYSGGVTYTATVNP